MSWAATYVGVPFGEGPGQCTCWELVRRVYAEVRGIVLPVYGEISARDLLAVARGIRDGQERWRAVDAPQAFDVALLRSGRSAAVVHVGVMVDTERLLHVEEASAAVIVPIRHFTVASRIAGYRRYAGRTT